MKVVKVLTKKGPTKKALTKNILGTNVQKPKNQFVQANPNFFRPPKLIKCQGKRILIHVNPQQE